MKEVLKDYDFNITIRFLTGFILLGFIIYNLNSCEIEKIKKATEIEQLKKTGLP
jgi:hypothetical protein